MAYVSDVKKSVFVYAAILLSVINNIIMLLTVPKYEVIGTVIAAVFCVGQIIAAFVMLGDYEKRYSVSLFISGGLQILFYVPYKLALLNILSHNTFKWQLGVFAFAFTLIFCFVSYFILTEFKNRFSGEEYKIFPFAALPAIILVNAVFYFCGGDWRISLAITSALTVLSMIYFIYRSFLDAQRLFSLVPMVLGIAVVISCVFGVLSPVSSHEHSYLSKKLSSSTCAVNGEKLMYCVLCSDEHTESIELSKHTYIESARTEPTCVQVGTVTYSCSVCGDSYSEELPLAEHNYEETARVESTCVTEGTASFACTVCGLAFSQPVPISEAVHSYQLSSYTEKGFFAVDRETMRCEHCGITYTTAAIRKPVIKSILLIILLIICIAYIAYIVDDEAGYWEDVFKRVGFWISLLIGLASAVVFSMILIVNLSKGESAKWYDKFLVKDYNSNGHSVVETSRVEPTCTTTGMVYYGCNACDDVYEEILPKSDHTISETERTEPTCSQSGRITYLCSVCGHNVYESIDPLPHAFVEERVEATCASHGAVKNTCSVCGYEENEKIPQLKHNYVAGEYTKGTFFKSGEQSYSCSICGDTYTAAINEHAVWKIVILSVIVILLIVIMFIFDFKNFFMGLLIFITALLLAFNVYASFDRDGGKRFYDNILISEQVTTDVQPPDAAAPQQ